MMKLPHWGVTFLIAGTCIGGAVIALPITLSPLGLLWGWGMMIFMALIGYGTAKIGIALQQGAPGASNLPTLARQCGNFKLQILSHLYIKGLSTTLLVLYTTAGAEILNRLLQHFLGWTFLSDSQMISLYFLITLAILNAPFKKVDLVNRVLFTMMIFGFLLLIAGLLSQISFTNLPLMNHSFAAVKSWSLAIPTAFTSFGFQLALHTAAFLCPQEAALKRSILWGLVISAAVYLLWTVGVLGALFNHAPGFYNDMAEGRATIGQTIQHLSGLIGWPFFGFLVWGVSFLAIFTSNIGIGLAFVYSTEGQKKNFKQICFQLLPIYGASLFFKSSILSILTFAGMISAIGAIVIPCLLFQKRFPERWRGWLVLLWGCAILVFISEFINIW